MNKSNTKWPVNDYAARMTLQRATAHIIEQYPVCTSPMHWIKDPETKARRQAVEIFACLDVLIRYAAKK